MYATVFLCKLRSARAFNDPQSATARDRSRCSAAQRLTTLLPPPASYSTSTAVTNNFFASMALKRTRMLSPTCRAVSRGITSHVTRHASHVTRHTSRHLASWSRAREGNNNACRKKLGSGGGDSTLARLPVEVSTTNFWLEF